MMYREIIALCSQIHTKHINTAVWAERRIVSAKLVVHIVTTGLQKEAPKTHEASSPLHGYFSLTHLSKDNVSFHQHLLPLQVGSLYVQTEPAMLPPRAAWTSGGKKQTILARQNNDRVLHYICMKKYWTRTGLVSRRLVQ
jgi:hypothetical protein